MKVAGGIFAGIGMIVVLCLVGWAIAHPIMVGYEMAGDIRALESKVQSLEWDTMELNWDSGPVDNIFIEIGHAVWLDKIAYSLGLTPDGGMWELQTVMDAALEQGSE